MMKIYIPLLAILFSNSWAQDNCMDLSQEECNATDNCQWSEELDMCINWDSGMHCEELDFETCQWIPMCEWNEDGNICEQDDQDYCSDYSQDICEILPMCQWNSSFQDCEHGGFDWDGDNGEWDDWHQFGNCSELGEDICEIIPSCIWNNDSGNCQETDQYNTIFTIQNLDIYNGILDVVITTNAPFFNFQLQFSGIELLYVSGGILENYDVNVDYDISTISGHLNEISDIPPGSHTLFTVEFTPLNETVCVYDGHCNGMWSHGNWNADNGVEASDCITISEYDNENYYANLLNGYLNEYFQYLAENEQGFISYITIEDIIGNNIGRNEDFGNDIGLMDHTGNTSYDTCPPEEGNIIAGNGKWQGVPVTIPVFIAVDDCLEEGDQLPGFIPGNLIFIHLWDEGTQAEYIMEPGDQDYLQWDQSFLIIPNIRISHDLNADGVMNVQDIVLLVNIILIEGEFIQSADVNMDGMLNILDVILMVEMII